MTALAGALLLSLAGCTKVGPEFGGVHPPALPEAPESNASHERPDAWWKTFDDPVLTSLIDKAARQNLDLQSAGLRILQSRAALGLSRGLAYPQVQTLSGSAGISRLRDRNVNAAGINFDLGWEMDIWGKYARGIESSEALLYASVASYADIMVSVYAEIARNYIAYRTAQERITFARRNITIQKRVVEMTQVQYNSGNVSELDMQQARSQLYSTRAVLPELQNEMVRSRNALAVLLGTFPRELDPLLKNKASVTVPAAKTHGNLYLQPDAKTLLAESCIPVPRLDDNLTFDAALLARRPDLKAAEHLAHAESAKIGVVTADLYPSFTLFGTIGYNPTDATGNWVGGSKAVGISAGPSFSWNIWQYDRIRNRIRAQDAAFELRLIDYNKKVLQAVGEVDSALSGYRFARIQLDEIEHALDATVRAFNLSATQYNDGLVSYQRLLSTVERLTTIQDRYAQIKGALATDSVLLYKALGGGWQRMGGTHYLSKERATRMRARTDWGEYLDDNATLLPEELP